MRFLAAVVAATLLAGCSSSPSGPVDLEDRTTVDAEWFKEINLRLEAGQDVEWSWSSSAQLRFNVHSHQGDELTEHVAREATADNGTFTVPSDGGYSLMWENPGFAPVDLVYEVRSEGALVSVVP